jgi:hypothetical protein
VLYKGNNVEFIGRGTSHQIDLPYEFNYFIPFVNPSQVIGEAKYYDNAIYKHIIRSFIGVITDIESNYVVSHLPNVCGLKERRLTKLYLFQLQDFTQKLKNLLMHII